MTIAEIRQAARRLKHQLLSGCGDNSCQFGPKVPRGGMGTNGGCRCGETIADALGAVAGHPLESNAEAVDAAQHDCHPLGVFGICHFCHGTEPTQGGCQRCAAIAEDLDELTSSTAETEPERLRHEAHASADRVLDWVKRRGETGGGGDITQEEWREWQALDGAWHDALERYRRAVAPKEGGAA